MKTILSITLVLLHLCCIAQQVAEPAANPASLSEQQDARVATKADEFIKMLSEKIGIGIRKSYDASSKDENKPATFMWNRDFENGQDYMLVDLGLKITEAAYWKEKLVLLPKFEWHRDDNQLPDKKKNTIGMGLNYEFMPFAIPDKSPKIVPYLIGSFEYKYDQVKKLETANYKTFVSFLGEGNGMPVFPHRINGKFFLEYYLNTGFEYYQSLEGDNLRCGVWVNRIFLDLRPIPALSSYFQLTADYTFRVVTADNLYNHGNMQWGAFAANIYFNSKQNIGVGVEYTTGEDPLTNFVATNKMTFGVKVKI